MLSKKMNNAINEQIKMEAYASNYYLAMASWCEQKGLEGSTAFFYAQAEEEREHMMRFFRYVNEADGKAVVPAVAQPPADFESFSSLFDIALAHEKKVTAAIDKIMALALETNDFRTRNMLEWFINEQLEEENQMQILIDKLNLVGDAGLGLYMIDAELGQKAAAKPAEEA